jgi:hypothetical protein
VEMKTLLIAGSAISIAVDIAMALAQAGRGS